MNIYKVGTLYHPDKTRWPEKVEYNFRQGAHELLMFLERPNAQEIASITKGKAEFALTVDGPILFFLYRFEPSFRVWSDSPFSIHCVPSEQRTPAELPQPFEERALLNIFVVDALNGILRGMRAVTFSPEFTAELANQIAQQENEAWRPGEFDRRLQGIYARESSEQLARRAIIRCKGGS